MLFFWMQQFSATKKQHCSRSGNPHFSRVSTIKDNGVSVCFLIEHSHNYLIFLSLLFKSMLVDLSRSKPVTTKKKGNNESHKHNPVPKYDDWPNNTISGAFQFSPKALTMTWGKCHLFQAIPASCFVIWLQHGSFRTFLILVLPAHIGKNKKGAVLFHLLILIGYLGTLKCILVWHFFWGIWKIDVFIEKCILKKSLSFQKVVYS